MIFTASTKDYADLIIDVIDPNKEFIKHRYYRDHTSIMNMEVVKDLTKIKRDLKRTILIDNLESNLKLQPNNGLHIKTWTDDIFDKQLLYIGKILKDFIKRGVDDVRKEIKIIKEKIAFQTNNGNNGKKIINGEFNYSGFDSMNEPDYQDIYLSINNEDL